MKIAKLLSLALVIALIFSSCKKDPNPIDEEHVHNHENTNDVVVNITNVADNQIIQLSSDVPFTASTPKYINANNDTFSVSILKYYISNIKLKRPNGSYYVVPETYFLINAADTINTCKFVLKDIPVENYIAMEFIVGVDSTRNCSGAQTGALDPLNDMFWSWNQGYIFFKCEGHTSSAPHWGLDRETAEIDALIAEQERLLEVLAEKRQAVISHAVTKGLNPDAPMEDSGVAWLGEVPAHWDVARVRYRWSFITVGVCR